MILRSIHQWDIIFTWYWCIQREQTEISLSKETQHTHNTQYRMTKQINKRNINKW